jgi:signal peptidase I
LRKGQAIFGFMINVFAMSPRQITKRASSVRFWIVGVLIGFLLVLAYLFTPIRVSGNSMNPTFHSGEMLFLQRFFKTNYRHSDIVVFEPSKELKTTSSRFIKRLIAIPGDSLSIRDDVVYLNGQKLTEPYVAQHSSRPENFPELIVSKGEVVAFEGFALAELPDYLKATLAMLEPLPQDILEQSQKENITYVGTLKLKEDFYFVLGDNRGFSASEDSRLFGAIPKRDILGTVLSF